MKLWSASGTLLHTWKDHCYIDVVGSTDGNYIAFNAGGTNSVHVINLENNEIFKSFEEEDRIRSMAMSKDGKFLLINSSCITPMINLWDIEGEKIIQSFHGHKQEKYILRC